MTPTPLTGFIIHSRPYQEKRAIYTFFCQNMGLIDGVGSRGLPSFVPMTLMMSGKGTLKNFKEPFLLTDNPNMLNHRLPLSLQYAALYLNEILYKLLPKDDPQPKLWQIYYQTLVLFDIGCDNPMLRYALRRFEWALFMALGLPIVFENDGNNEPIAKHGHYLYQNELGFLPTTILTPSIEKQSNFLLGKDILAMNEFCQSFENGLDCLDSHQIDHTTLNQLSYFFRHLIDELLDFRPLYSRQLWADQKRLANL